MIKYQDQKVKPSKYALIRWFGFDQFEPERAVTSYWISSKAFFVIRFLLALYSTVVFWTYLGLLASFADVRGFFSAFTTLTFIGLHAYLIVGLFSRFNSLFFFCLFMISSRLLVYIIFVIYGIKMSTSY